MNKSKVEIKVDKVFSIHFSSDITSFDTVWEKVNGDSTYLSIAYLRALQNSEIPFLDFVYVVLYKNNSPIGCVYFQKVALKDSLLDQDRFPNEQNKLRSFVLKHTNTDILVCGNFFATGVNGFFFLQPELENLLPGIVDLLSSYLKKHERKVNLLMFKEFWIDKNTKLQEELGDEYVKFQIDVNMILDILPKWDGFDTYLDKMTTKYRTRAKSVYKKTSKLVEQDFSSELIRNHLDEIDRLFDKVLKTSNFNVVQPRAILFYQLKKKLKEKFIFKGYFFQDTLVAFSVATFNQNYLDANYVGIDYEMNKSFPLYQRLLYDYVDLAIQKRVKRLRLGRTAEIMKSSLGAIPVPMNLYIKHTSLLLHQVLKPTLQYVKPSDFEIRKPFKEIN